MNADEYQALAARTLIDRPDQTLEDLQVMLAWNTLGLVGEAGEVAELIKKGVFHQHGIDRVQLAKELGDVLWYVAALCTKLNLSLADVMYRNVTKLIERYPDGYSAQASINRPEETR